MPQQVVLSPGGTFGPTPSNFISLKDQVAVILGRQLDGDSLVRCGQFINRAIKELNTRPWKALLTSGTNITTAAATQTYSLDSLFYKESKVQRLDNDGNPEFTLGYMDWEYMQSKLDIQTETGKPRYYTLRNTQKDGLITLYPVPDAAYTLTVEYYKRIALLSNDGDLLDVPIEFENFVIARAQFYLLDLFHHERTADKGAEADLHLARLIRADEIHPDNASRIRLPRYYTQAGTILIKAN